MNSSNEEDPTLLQYPRPWTEKKINVFLGTLTACIAVITIFGNLVTIIAIIKAKSRSLRRPHIILICCLSLVDFSIGLFHLVFVAIACFIGGWVDSHDGQQEIYAQQIENNNIWCMISSYLVQVFSKMAISTVAVIGIERIATMRFHLKAEAYVTNRNVMILLAITWAVQLGLLVQAILPEHTYAYMMPAFQCVASYKHSDDVTQIIWTSIAFNFVCFTTIIIACAYTLYTLLQLRWKAQRQMGEAKDASKRKMIITLTILLLMCIDTSTWLPQYVISTMRFTLSPETAIYQAVAEYNVRTTVWWIQYLSPALNPIIYALRLKAVRAEIKMQFKFFCHAVYVYKGNRVNTVQIPMLRRSQSGWHDDHNRTITEDNSFYK